MSAPWESIACGGLVETVEHDPENSGLEYKTTFHFQNIPGSPKVLVNARRAKFSTTSNHLVSSVAKFLPLIVQTDLNYTIFKLLS